MYKGVRMNLKTAELQLVLNWFDYAESNLGDDDLKLYDKIKEHLEEKGIDFIAQSENEDDELAYYPEASFEEDYDGDDYDNFDD